MPPKPTVRITGSPGIVKQTLMPSNVTKHFVRTTGNNGGGHPSSPESPYFNQQQVIRNYLNQTMPLPAQRYSRTRDSAMPCQDGRGSHLIERTASRNIGMTNSRAKSATRGSQAARGVDVARRRSSTTATTMGMATACDKSRFLSSHSQNHGVIAASVYRELCNGTIGW